jgi:hypothetical protein
MLPDLTGSRGFRRRDSLCVPTQAVEFSCRSRKPGASRAGIPMRCALRTALLETASRGVTGLRPSLLY